MSISISVDGGGTKFIVVAFDNNFELRARASTKGTNLLFNKLDEVLMNVDLCLDECLTSICLDEDIEAVYVSLAGESKSVFEHIKHRFHASKIIRLGEYPSALLAGGLCEDGLIAISGTGGGVCYICPNSKTVGGWGALMGDWGSGFWIGQQGCYASVRMCEGWGEDTLIYNELMSEYDLPNLRELVNFVYNSKSYQQTIAGLSKAVSRAAENGDKIALDIFERAGVLMAKQLIALVKQNNIKTESLPVVINGGAWKGNVVMFNAFYSTVKEIYPNLMIKQPLFEPVMGGVIKALIENNVDISAEILLLLKTNFKRYLWKGVGYATE